MGVPTPTGVLQGAAAFSWDGSAWQPSGRAGPGVGTPTGVLLGVAPFSWDGTAWQPSGRAGPGVATPTGTLRGVAAFNWDGAAWQPAGQAGPSVATPYGVLDGVAMFNWTGSAWAAVQGPTLDLVFSGPALDPRLTFTRASTATYFDASGTMQTAASNAPRFDYDPNTHVLNGLLIEDARTNVLLNSATLGTQSVAVTAQAYALSFYGTGTVTLSGTSTAGPLVGTGAFPTRVALSFTPTAGTLTLTVTGSVLSAQLEAGAFPTSYIPTTAAAVTRAVDVCTMPVGAWFNAVRGTLGVEGIPTVVAVSNTNQEFVSVGADGSNLIRLVLPNGLGTMSVQQWSSNVNRGSIWPANSLTNGVAFKAVTTYDTVAAVDTICLNGGTIASVAVTLPPTFTTLFIGGGRGAAPSSWIHRVRYWPRVLSNSELQSVTT
jgi:hypothetical protein